MKGLWQVHTVSYVLKQGLGAAAHACVVVHSTAPGATILIC